MTTSREEIAKLCERLRERAKNAREYWENYERGGSMGDLRDADLEIAAEQEQSADALLSQQRSLDRVAALCDADPEYLKAVGELPAFIRAVRAALEGREFRENA